MSRRGFGAMELISVLAILAILTVLVLPRVLKITQTTQAASQTVSDAHLTQVFAQIHSLEPALAAHLAQFGSLASLNGTPLKFSETYDNFGQVLLTEGLIERPFELKLGTNATLRLVKTAGVANAAPMNGSNGMYDLDGDGKSEMTGTACVLEAVIPGVNELEARALNDRVDGPRLGAASGQGDYIGRVVYPPAGPDGTTTAHIFIFAK